MYTILLDHFDFSTLRKILWSTIAEHHYNTNFFFKWPTTESEKGIHINKWMYTWVCVYIL